MSNGTPSRCSALRQAVKSGSVLEVPSSSTFMSMRWAAAAEAGAIDAKDAATDATAISTAIGFAIDDNDGLLNIF